MNQDSGCFVASAAILLASSREEERSSPMQEHSDQIVISETGAFIPKKLFGKREQIVNKLDQAGVFAPLGGW